MFRIALRVDVSLDRLIKANPHIVDPAASSSETCSVCPDSTPIQGGTIVEVQVLLTGSLAVPC